MERFWCPECEKVAEAGEHECPVRCIKCQEKSTDCSCTGGPMEEPECTCYELFHGLGGTAHQLGCAFYGRTR